MGITIRDSDFKELEQQLIQIVNETERSDTMLVVVYGHDGFRIKKQDLRRPRIDNSGGCTVKIVRAQRDTPKAKSTEWALQRQLLVHPDCDVEEYIIEDGEGNILEGFSSNLLFITKDGIYSTDKSLVLQGTILGVVERLFDIKFGLIKDLEDVKAMAICSTSRLVLPVSRVNHHGQVVELNSSACERVQEVRSKVDEWIAKYSMG